MQIFVKKDDKFVLNFLMRIKKLKRKFLVEIKKFTAYVIKCDEIKSIIEHIIA